MFPHLGIATLKKVNLQYSLAEDMARSLRFYWLTNSYSFPNPENISTLPTLYLSFILYWINFLQLSAGRSGTATLPLSSSKKLLYMNSNFNEIISSKYYIYPLVFTDGSICPYACPYLQVIRIIYLNSILFYLLIFPLHLLKSLKCLFLVNNLYIIIISDS